MIDNKIKQSKYIISDFLANWSDMMDIRGKFIHYFNSIVNTQFKIRNHFELKKQKRLKISSAIEKECTNAFGTAKKSKTAKKKTKVFDEFKTVSKLSKEHIIKQYIQFRYHIFGIRFFKFWYQTHPDFDYLKYTNSLKIEALILHKEIFSGVKVTGVNSKKSKTKLKCPDTKLKSDQDIIQLASTFDKKMAPLLRKKSLKLSSTI